MVNATMPFTFKVHKGMEVVPVENRALELRLSPPIGHGTMMGYLLSPHAVICAVDFRCAECPNMTQPDEKSQRKEEKDDWFSVNYCIEGRCETDIPHAGVAVVSEDDTCVSFAHTPDGANEPPKSFRYPLARYVGIELFVNTAITRDPAFSILGSLGEDPVELWRKAGTASVFPNDGELIAQMRRCLASAQVNDMVQANVALLEILHALMRRNFEAARPQVLLAPAQLRMAKAAHDLIEAAPTKAHDARDIAASMGISATTLNGHFEKVYGATIAAYTRGRRIDLAKRELAAHASVAQSACAAGYSNPSKFAAAFKRETGLTPSAFRKQAQTAQ